MGVLIIVLLGACVMICLKVTAMSNGSGVRQYEILISSYEKCWQSFERHFVYFSLGVAMVMAITLFVIIDNLRIRKIAQALKESKEKYLIATKNADFSVWELDIINRRIIQSEHSREVHGNTKVIENVPESIIDSGYVMEEDIDRFLEMYNKIIAGEPSVEGEFWVKSKNKSDYWCERVAYTTIFDKQGKPIKAIGSSKDITIEKEIEKKYNEEIYYRTCVDTDVIGSFHFNLTKNWCGEGQSDIPQILALQESGTVDGFFEAEYALNAADEILNEYKNIFNRSNLMKSFYEGTSQMSFDHKYYIYEKQKTIWITTFILMIQNPKTGDVEGFIYSRNINNQKINEQIMKTVIGLEYDFITVIDGVKNTFFLYETNQDSTLPLMKNGNYDEAVLDYAKRFVFGEDEEQYIQDSSLNEILKQLEENNNFTVYYRVVEPSGRIRWKKSYYAYMNEKDKTIIGTRVDVTQIYDREEKKNELLKHALAAAQQANRAKTVFLSNMSHDIRTPMNAIIGMTKIAKMDIDNKEKVLNSLKIIDSSGKHLLEIINDILDMSRIESGNLVFAKEVFNLRSLVEDIVSMNEPLMEEKQQTFEVNLIDLKHNTLKGDELKLRQVIINLLSNANKFTPQGGHISLTIKETKSSQDGYACFQVVVEDNGIGISKENQEVIFNPFIREEIGVVNKLEGTGLGLSIVKNIVEARGGRIWVESEIGKGSKFIFEFASVIADKSNPVVEEKKQKKVDTNINCSGVKVLLVEDNEINVMVASQLFEKLGATVVSASNGANGYDKFVSSEINYYDIIFMDIQMPVMNGYEATKAIRESKHKQAKTIPIVAMTADVFAEDIAKAHEMGLNAHLGKPLEFAKMCEVLNDFSICRKM